jgi:hypothetical protein
MEERKMLLKKQTGDAWAEAAYYGFKRAKKLQEERAHRLFARRETIAAESQTRMPPVFDPKHQIPDSYGNPSG